MKMSPSEKTMSGFPWHKMKLFDASLKSSFDDSDPRITHALEQPGLYVIRLNGVHPSKGYHVIKLGRTDTARTAKLKTRLRDYFSANPYQFSVVALGLTRRPKFTEKLPTNETHDAMDDKLAKYESANYARGHPVLEAERDLKQFVNAKYQDKLVAYPTQRQEFYNGPIDTVEKIQETMIEGLKNNWNIIDILLFDHRGISEHFHNEQLDIPWHAISGAKRESAPRPHRKDNRVIDGVQLDEPNFQIVPANTRGGLSESLRLLKKPPLLGGKFRWA